jgi:predicted ester cyclase
MSPQENQAIVRRLFDEIFNKGNFAVADEIIAGDYQDHSPLPAPESGPQGFKMRAQMLRAAFVSQVVFGPFLADGDLVAFTWGLTGVHDGAFVGIAPTGKQVSLSGINVERLAGGKIVEHWSQFDLVGLLRQMEATSLPRPGGG